MTLKPPCKDCPNRAMRCAVECERWEAYTKERNKNYAVRIIYRNVANAIHDVRHTHSKRINVSILHGRKNKSN